MESINMTESRPTGEPIDAAGCRAVFDWAFKTALIERHYSRQSKLISALQEQLQLERHRQFGKKSEKHDEDDPQAHLFDEAECTVASEAEKATDDDESDTIIHVQNRSAYLKALERASVESDITDFSTFVLSEMKKNL